MIQARQLALAKEKIRSQQIASLPPPIDSGLNDLLNKAKASFVQVVWRVSVIKEKCLLSFCFHLASKVVEMQILKLQAEAVLDLLLTS